MKNEPIAIYARYSSDRQDPRSIEDQERRCREHARRAGYEVAQVYTDAAISGAHVDRKGIQTLLRESKRRPAKFGAVLVDDLSRLSRDLGDTFRIVFDELAAENVRVVDVTTGIASTNKNARLTFGALALVNDQFLQLVRDETHRGLEGRALSGFWTGGRVYGYTTIPEENAPDPEHTRMKPIIEENEAVIVRRIFTLFAEGTSLKRIASTLNEENIAAPHDGGKGNKIGRGWGHTTIRAMLKNERYIGTWKWNTCKWVRVPGKKSRRRISRAEDEHVTKQLPELAIISEGLWNRVQERFAGRKKGRGKAPATGKQPYLISGLMRCGTCGGSMTITGTTKKNGERYATFGCTTHHSRGASVCPNNLTISERKATRALIGALQDVFSDPAIIGRFRGAFEARLAERQAKAPDSAKELERRISEAERRVKNVTEAFARATWSEALLAQLREEEERLATLKGQRATTKSNNASTPTDDQIEGYAKNLFRVLEADAARGREILARSLAPVVLTPYEKLGQRSYRMSGALNVADVLSEKKTSAPEGEPRSVFSEVAGACYFTYLRLLKCWRSGSLFSIGHTEWVWGRFRRGRTRGSLHIRRRSPRAAGAPPQ
jgi:DNA invertase Pin-like site-specific DNA recombinase